MKLRGIAIALAAAALLLGCKGAEPAAATESLPIDVRAVEVTPAELHGLRLVEAVELSADHARFGGFSGLLIEPGRLTAVTDAGWLLTTNFSIGIEGGIGLTMADFRPLPGTTDSSSKAASDAESLARSGGRLAIGFEHDHRIELIEDGRIAEVHRDRRFERMPSNNGLEALAGLPDGGLLAIGEKPVDGAFPAFVLRVDGGIAEGALPRTDDHAVTGADLGPDGRLYLLRRHFSILAGISIRIERYELDPSGFPRPRTRELLAAFKTASGIDNMEGIAVWRAPDGGVRLAILSDDNFNSLQRTLLLLFQVTE